MARKKPKEKEIEVPDIMDLAAVGVFLGQIREGDDKTPLLSTTVSKYVTESREGGRYEEHPFPPPNGYIGRAPYWMAARAPEIREWAEGRPGQGAGGGRPWHKEREEA